MALIAPPILLNNTILWEHKFMEMGDSKFMFFANQFTVVTCERHLCQLTEKRLLRADFVMSASFAHPKADLIVALLHVTQ